MRIRKATADDVPALLELVRALATYEREPHAVVATQADYLRDGFGADPAFHVLFAESEEGGTYRPVGFALWFFAYSTWTGTRCLHLEDLFVLPQHRGDGVGARLLHALAAEAVRTGCKRLACQVLDWNAPAIGFYEKLGARVLPEWKNVRFEGPALDGLAAPPPDGC